MNKQTVLVTGANGFIGLHLCNQLAAQGYSVVGLVYGKESADQKNSTWVSGDVTDFAGTLEIIKKYKPEVVFHLAALVPNPSHNAHAFFDTNVLGTLNVLEACRQSGVKTIIYSSSMRVYGDNVSVPVAETHTVNPADVYGLSKKQGEDWCKLYHEIFGLNVIILRYAGVYGAEKKDGVVNKFITNALAGNPLEVNNDSTWDIVYVGDVIAATIEAFKKAETLKFDVINIGSGQETSVKELAKAIIKISGSHSEIKENTSTFGSRFYFDISKAKKLLGYKPMAVAEGLTKTIESIKK